MKLQVLHVATEKPLFDGHVAYIVQGKNVIYTFHEERPVSKLLTLAEGYLHFMMRVVEAVVIIQAICRAECLRSYEHSFFELQTRFGYADEFEAGGFALYHLLLHGEDRIEKVDWEPVACSDSGWDLPYITDEWQEGVIEIFRSYIR